MRDPGHWTICTKTAGYKHIEVKLAGFTTLDPEVSLKENALIAIYLGGRVEVYPWWDVVWAKFEPESDEPEVEG